MTARADYSLSRRTVLAASGAAALLGGNIPNSIAAAGKGRSALAKHVILFWNAGGMSHLDTWDPKPGRPSAGELGTIHTSVPGIRISAIFPQLARQMHHCSLIRSLVGTQRDHVRATYELLTGYVPVANVAHPGIGSVVAHALPNRGDLPAYVSISGQAPRAGRWGQASEAYFVASPGDRDPRLAVPAELHSERFAGHPALKAFDFSKLPAKTTERYGDTPFGRGALLAKRLVEQGVRCVQVNRDGFDTHSHLFASMRDHGDVIDPALAALVQDLAETGLLEQTLVIMLSEFGRSPKINQDAGRDHWSNVFSCFLAGGGMPCGAVIGSSDADGAYPQDHPMAVGDLHTMIYRALGIDPKSTPPDSQSQLAMNMI